MANRSYLYSTNFNNCEREKNEDNNILGLSECNYFIPISFLILVSHNPKTSYSLIWDNEDKISIQGEYRQGVDRLLKFLEQLLDMQLFEKTELVKKISATKSFLNDPKTQLKYIVLEGGELFDMGKHEINIENQKLLDDDIMNIDKSIDSFINGFKKSNQVMNELHLEMNKLKKKGDSFFSKIFNKDYSDKTTEIQNKITDIKKEMWFYLGIDDWSDILYYDLSKEI